MEVGASCHGGIQLWPLPRRGCCLLGGISKKLLRETAVGAWDKWQLLLRSSRTTNAGLLVCRSCCSGYCTWGGVGTGRGQTKLCVEMWKVRWNDWAIYFFFWCLCLITVFAWTLIVHVNHGLWYSNCMPQNPCAALMTRRASASTLYLQ